MAGPGYWHWRRRRRGWLGRKPMPRRIYGFFKNVVFMPMQPPLSPPANALEIYPDELEALRLVYLENLSQNEAASMMGISRGTLWRLLESGRRKLVQALVEVRPIVLVTP